MRRRGELVERPFAHYLDAGGMRRTHLRKHGNILKRLLVHVAGFNLGILMRSLIGTATPREFAEIRRDLLGVLSYILDALAGFESLRWAWASFPNKFSPDFDGAARKSSAPQSSVLTDNTVFSTGC